jgi:hypothetical protein
MNYTLPVDERTHLRTLARKQADIAALPVMHIRRKLWTDMNDAKPGARPPFAIESWTFDRDFLPPALFRCKTEYGRQLEARFLRNIRHHEILNDDHVCPDTLDLEWHVHLNEYGIDIKTEYLKDGEGQVLGYHFNCPVTDLNEGFDMIKPSTFSVDREGTRAEQSFLEETFGDILPVVLRSYPPGRNNLTQRLMRIMSMETFFVGMMDCPDKVHGVMALLRDNARRMNLWAEAEGLLTLNNGNQCTCGTCFNFTTLLPNRQVAPGQVRLKDLWESRRNSSMSSVSRIIAIWRRCSAWFTGAAANRPIRSGRCRSASCPTSRPSPSPSGRSRSTWLIGWPAKESSIRASPTPTCWAWM